MAHILRYLKQAWKMGKCLDEEAKRNRQEARQSGKDFLPLFLFVILCHSLFGNFAFSSFPSSLFSYPPPPPKLFATPVLTLSDLSATELAHKNRNNTVTICNSTFIYLKR